jgi:catechol 2,3-dioxygenase-like lactoylglutathione lyase family enzyme
MPARFLSHVGICVADLDRSIQFYCNVLDFEEIHRLHVNGPEAAQLIQLGGDMELDAVYLQRDGVRIELLHYPVPGSVGKPEARPLNGLGLTHLSFRVEDLPAMIDAIIAAGGRLLEGTQIYNEAYRAGAVFLTDPDGTRIELVESPGDPTSLPGA